eukprot:SM000206S06251  [mRNA]  locus=s206:46070:47232:- [translate_table: standard]
MAAVLAYSLAPAATAQARSLSGGADFRGRATSTPRRDDRQASLVRLDIRNSDDPRYDSRGWMLDPLAAAAQIGLEGGATACTAVHLGEIKAGSARGNHRHHHCNETFILWGGQVKFRNEAPDLDNGYVDVILEPFEVAVATGRIGMAHAISNLHEVESAYLFACQDAIFDKANPSTDYNVWPSLT